MSDDHRSPLAKARDTWLASEEGQRCLAGTATGQYLENRLVLAFIAGADSRAALALVSDAEQRLQEDNSKLRHEREVLTAAVQRLKLKLKENEEKQIRANTPPVG